jgi:hypothetical protein
MAKPGYQTRGDVLVNQLADGVELGVIWDEINSVLGIYNSHRSALASLLSFHTDRPGDAVAQAIGAEKFEEATEFGIPRGIGRPDYIKIGYSFKDFDIASRFTWKALRSMTSEQVTGQVTRIIEADNRLVCGSILNRLFNNVPWVNDYGHTVYPLWSGDGMVPPPQMGQTFDGTHQHYLTALSTTLDADDVENMIRHVRQHGYGTTQAAQFLLLMNPVDVETSLITSWRAGVEYRTGMKPKFDFIPSSNAPARLTNERVEGAVPPPDYNGLPVTGSYGRALLIESYYIPAGYVAVVASGGPDSDTNPVGFREHENSAYHGLRTIPGNFQGYPLIETYYARAFGTGIRHRGAAVVCQLTASSTYTPPVFAL